MRHGLLSSVWTLHSQPLIRPFTWEDLEPLTEVVNRVQGLEGSPHAYDPLFLGECLGQPGYEPLRNCAVAERGGELVGYALVVPELAIGRVVVEGGVLPPYRRRGLGRRLLGWALERASALGARVVHICVPQGEREGLAFLAAQGFQVVRRYWDLRWEGEAVPPLSLPEGFALRPFQPGLEEALTLVQNAAFQGQWGFCPNTVEQVAYRVRLRRCRPEGIPLLVHQASQERVAGYCWTRLDGPPGEAVGVVWMVGVHPHYRGTGLGRTVLLAGMDYLWRQGVQAIELTVDQANTPACRLYFSLGYRPLRELLWHEQRLP